MDLRDNLKINYLKNLTKGFYCSFYNSFILRKKTYLIIQRFLTVIVVEIKYYELINGSSKFWIIYNLLPFHQA